MKKAKMETKDIVLENIDKIEKSFPDVMTERKGKDGKITKGIDFDKLRQLLSKDIIDDNDERYEFTWVGKNQAIVESNEPIRKTLRPCIEESKNFDTTENLYIEGDNLDVLKLLQESYLGEVKMIYIDPPYNRGKDDLTYKDRFTMDNEEYDEEIEYRNEDAEIQFKKNEETNPRFHSDWCSIIYPRLKLAKNLLRDDGVIFISIDDSEVRNLRCICDEIFGEINFVATLIWNTEGHTDNQFQIKVNHEYILVYSNNIKNIELGWVIDSNTREESNLWKGFAENSITKNGAANPPKKIILKKGFPCSVQKLNLKSNKPDDSFFEEVKKIGYITRQITSKYNVTYPIRMTDLIVENGVLTQDVELFTGWGSSDKLQQFIDNNFKHLIEKDGEVSYYLSVNGVVYYYKKRDRARHIVSVLKNLGTTEKMQSKLESESIFFAYPKPDDLIKYLIRIGSINHNDIILDFFSGSATTADAVMQLNSEDGGNRKFIMVQVPQKTDEKSEAFKAGYTNICEIGKERIRRAGQKIEDEINSQNKQITLGEEPKTSPDTGFRVLKVDDSNMKDIYYSAVELTQTSLNDNISNVKEDRNGLDLLFGILLDWGLELSSTFETINIDDISAYNYDNGSLVACLDDKKVTENMIKEIAKIKPMRVVFRDSCFDNSASKINLEEIFKAHAPETEIKVI